MNSNYQDTQKLHKILERELRRYGEKSRFLQHLKNEHPDVYAGLISECQTHGLSIKGKITDFVNDAAKLLPDDRMSGVRKALQIIEEKPELISKSTIGWWIAGIVTAVGIGAYLFNTNKTEQRSSPHQR